MLFWKWGCLIGPENRIFRKLISVDPKQLALTTEIILHFHFHFKAFPEKERERERERESERARGRRPSSSPVRPSPVNPELQSAPISRASVRRPWSEIAISRSTVPIAIARGALRDRDRCFARSRRRSRSCLREIAPSIAIDSTVVGLELAKHCAVNSWASIVDDFFSRFCPCFSGFVFSFLFSKH